MGRTTNITTVQKVDPETGEITTTEKEQTIRYGKTSDFVMTFTKDLGYMKDLSRGEILVMFGLLQVVNQDNEVILNPSIKKRIATSYDLKINSINQLISNLVKKQMILKTEERGIYKLNTYLFGKGNWSNIKKQRMYTEWDFKHLTKKTVVEQDYLNEDEILEKQIQELEEKKEQILHEKEQQKNKSLFELE